VEYIERTNNTKADKLAKATARKAVLPPDVFFQVIKDPSAKTVEPEPIMVNNIQGEDRWAPIMAYLCHHYEPNNSTELIIMQQRVKSYQLIGDELYKIRMTKVSRNKAKYKHVSKGAQYSASEKEAREHYN
jgi:hypothetical protein